VQGPGRAEENPTAPVGVEDTPDKAHDDQALGCDRVDATPRGDEWEVAVEVDDDSSSSSPESRRRPVVNVSIYCCR
jgi:hypothetical protein